MINAIRFAAIHVIKAPHDQTAKPQDVTDIESKAQLHITTGPVDKIDYAPPPAEGGAPVKEWKVATDDDAFAIARMQGFNVLITNTPATNQAVIDSGVRQNSKLSWFFG